MDTSELTIPGVLELNKGEETKLGGEPTLAVNVEVGGEVTKVGEGVTEVGGGGVTGVGGGGVGVDGGGVGVDGRGVTGVGGRVQMIAEVEVTDGVELLDMLESEKSDDSVDVGGDIPHNVNGFIFEFAMASRLMG